MLFSILFILLITLGIGLPLILIIAPKINRIAALGLSYPIGMGIFTLLMFGTNILGFKFTLLNEALLLLLFSVPLIYFARRRLKNFFPGLNPKAKKGKPDGAEKAILGFVFFFTVMSFISTLYWPVHMWDSVVLYDFRGRVFASEGFMRNAFVDGYYIGYPLLTSLAHSLVYMAGGEYPQFLYSAFYVSLGVSFYGFLRKIVSEKTTLFFTAILFATGPLFYHSLFSYTNLPYTVFVSLGAISIFLWDREKDVGYLILSALLVGLSTWTRSSEPFWLAACMVVLIVSLYRKKFWNFPAYFAIVFPIREVWKIFQNSLVGGGGGSVSEIVGYSSIFSSLFDFGRWGMVLGYLYKYVVVPWGGLFAAFVLASVFVFLIGKRKDLYLIFVIVFILLAVMIAGTFYFSMTVENWYRIGDAANRLSMLFYPLLLYCSALIFSKNNSRQ